ncbi:MAG: PQQ-binding-like beta-propeller repeat protein [Pirellulales bacterium]
MRNIVLLLAAVLALYAIPVQCAENWPQFRGPHGDGMSTATGLPLTWSESEHIVWKTAVHGKAWSSPVIWNDQIWMTTATPEGHELYAVCVDRASGKILHDVKVFDIPEPQFCIELNSYASCTPVVEDGRVYVHFGSPGTAALDTRSGKILWTRPDLVCDHFRGPASSPILYGNLLVVALDGFDYQYVVAFDKRSGETVWRRDRNIEYGTDNGDVKKAYGTAKVIDVDGKPQLVYPSAGATIAYEPASGDEIWRVNHGGMNASNPPLFGHGLLYLNTAAGGFKLFAMRVGGTGDLTKTNVEWKCAQGVPTRSSPVLVDDLMFMVSDAGIATCIEAKTAKVVWQKRLKGEFSSSPICADGRIYFCNQEGQTFVVAASRDYELLATNELETGSMASPAVYDKAIYHRTKTHLYRLE